MNWTLRDTLEVLGFGVIGGLSLSLAMIIHSTITGAFGLIIGFVVAGFIAVFAVRKFIGLLDERSQKRWGERLPVLLLPAPKDSN